MSKKSQKNENIIISVEVYDTTDSKTAMDIADSALRTLNTAANVLDNSYALSSDKYYGGLYDEYSVEIRVMQSCNINNVDLWYIRDTISDGYDMVQLQNIAKNE